MRGKDVCRGFLKEILSTFISGSLIDGVINLGG
jgi:hypothetical protein